MADGYLVQHVPRQRVPEGKPGWTASSRGMVRIRKGLSFGAEPTRRSLVDRLRVGVGDLIGQAVAVPLVYVDLESVVVAIADTAIVEGRRNVRIWRSFLRIAGPRRQSGVVVSTDVEAPGARTHIIDVHGGRRIQLARHAKLPLHGVGIIDARTVEQQNIA